MNLKCAAAISLLRKILQHFYIADGSAFNVRLQKFAELVADDVKSRVTFGLQTLRDALIKLNRPEV